MVAETSINANYLFKAYTLIHKIFPLRGQDSLGDWIQILFLESALTDSITR
jgi:hypothetical protein